MEKRALTLIEIMVVIFIITLISGVVGYNLKGSMDKGRVFKTEQGIDQLRNLLLICVSEGKNIKEVATKPAENLEDFGLAKDPSKLVVDGWGRPYLIEVTKDGDDFSITSEGLLNYKKKHKK